MRIRKGIGRGKLKEKGRCTFCKAKLHSLRSKRVGVLTRTLPFALWFPLALYGLP